MRFLVAALALAGAAALAACGGSSGGEHLTGPPVPSHPAAFAWLHPGPVARGWRTRALPSGAATLAYPPGWRLTRTDPGTVTATLREGGRIAGYLNVTPRQGEETLANWASFRPAHNREEGDTHLVGIASARGLAFRNGRGACVEDSYRTGTGNPYTEIACIVRGRSATNVIVGAAPPERWSAVRAQVQRAISSFDA